jgi:transcriptional antiterminator
MDIRIIKKLHQYIITEQTGNPKKLANKIGVPERTVYSYISYIKMNAPIVFDNQKGNYIYERECVLCFKG